MTTWSDSIYDMSMVVFGIMSVLIYYLTYSYVPNELIENTFSLIIRDMNSGIICFDNAGRCIYCNGIVKEMYSITDNINEVEHNYASWLQTQTEYDNKKFRQTISEGKREEALIFHIIVYMMISIILYVIISYLMIVRKLLRF